MPVNCITTITKSHKPASSGEAGTRRQKMFDKFGEFDSWEELNKAAEGQKEEGDLEALKALAIENGFEAADAEDYMDGAVPEFCNALLAANCKIRLEEEDLKPEGIMVDWFDYIYQLISEDEKFRLAVRKKGKRVKECFGRHLKWGNKNKKPVDEEIKKAAGFSGNVQFGCPGILEARKIIKSYYLEG